MKNNIDEAAAEAQRRMRIAILKADAINGGLEPTKECLFLARAIEHAGQWKGLAEAGVYIASSLGLASGQAIMEEQRLAADRYIVELRARLQEVA